MDFTSTDVLSSIQEMLIGYAPKVLGAIVALIVGFWIIKWIQKGISIAMDKRNLDASLKPFLKSILGAILKIALFISVASILGIKTTSFIAILGAAGLAVGLALQGSLANFAGGVLILILKPFKVGDFITANGYSGTVKEIQIFYTIIDTTQNQQIVIPNGQVSNNAITNFSAYETRRFDLTFGIGYEDDIDKAKAILKKLIDDDERILKEPASDIFIEALADSSVNFHFRGWSKSSDFWDIVNNMNEKVKKAFDEEGISIPFPQRDVHHYNEK